MKKTKVCMVASCGGHIMELMQLLPVVEGKDYYFVTEKNVASKGLMAKHKHYYLILLSTLYFLWERPTTVITTGAGASYPTCKIAKMFARKVIYVESFAKLTSQSVTGKMVYPFADVFFVQWPEMQKVYPNAKYAGTVY